MTNSASILAARHLDLPEYLGALKLKEHQYDPTIMLLRPHIRGILAFYRVGSGKTASAILAAVTLISRGVVKTAVILTPASLRQNFIDEIKRTVYDPVLQKQLIANVYSIQAPNKIPIEKVAGSLLIIDEAHNLRAEGSRFDIIKNLSVKSAKNLLLTATPVYNYPPDIFPLLLLADHRLITASLIFGNNNNNNNVTSAQSKFRKEFGPYGTGKISPSGVKSTEPIVQDLRPLLACSVLYYEPTAADKQYYPKVIDQDVRIPMTKTQASVHRSLAEKQQKLNGIMTLQQFETTILNGGSLSSLSAYLGKYRMLGNAALVRPTIMVESKKTGKMYRKRGNVEKIESGKIPHIVNSLLRMLKTNNTGKAVVYSEFIPVGLELIEKELTARNISYGIFSGSVSIAQKNKYVNDYNADKLRILLISKAGAEGLTLKNTTELHIMEPGWNEEGVRQVIGRVSRFQSHTREPKTVNVYRYVSVYPPGFVDKTRPNQSLMMTGTADERLRDITKFKEKTNKHFLNLVIKLAKASVKECRSVNNSRVKWYNAPYYNFSNSNSNSNSIRYPRGERRRNNSNSNNNIPLSKRAMKRPLSPSTTTTMSTALVSVPVSSSRSKKRKRSFLKISPTNTNNNIKRRFRRLAKKYHPNKGGESKNFTDLRNELDMEMWRRQRRQRPIADVPQRLYY
jgi:SNF2 family DNA or RNA helicase